MIREQLVEDLASRTLAERTQQTLGVEGQTGAERLPCGQEVIVGDREPSMACHGELLLQGPGSTQRLAQIPVVGGPAEEGYRSVHTALIGCHVSSG